MRRKLGLILLNCAATAVLIGSCYDMFVPGVPDNLLDYLGMPRTEMSPRLAALLLGLLRAIGGCLLAISIAAFVLINGPVKRGEWCVSWTVLILIGVSEGINATQMWRFGSSWCWPLTFIAMTAVGIATLISGTKAKL